MLSIFVCFCITPIRLIIHICPSIFKNIPEVIGLFLNNLHQIYALFSIEISISTRYLEMGFQSIPVPTRHSIGSWFGFQGSCAIPIGDLHLKSTRCNRSSQCPSTQVKRGSKSAYCVSRDSLLRSHIWIISYFHLC